MRVIGLLLATALAAGAACLVEDLSPGATVDGNLGSTECRLRDIDSSSRSTSFAAQYRITIDRPGVLTLRLSSPTFNTVLYIYGSNGRPLATNDDADGGTNSRITIGLTPGAYTAVVASTTAVTGAYTLASAFDNPRNCVIHDINAGDSVGGTFSLESCRTLDFRTPSPDDRPVDRYKLTTSRRGVLTIDLTSSAFDTYLEIYDSQNRRLTRDHATAGAQHSRMVVSVNPGTYIIYAYPFRAAAGGYSLTTKAEAPRECSVREITAGEPVTGSFTDQSCRFLDLFTPSADRSYVEQFRVSVSKPSVLTAELRSTAFDAYLMVATPDYDIFFQNDDADRQTSNSRVVGSLAPGSYIVLATEYEPGAGAYSLSLSTEDTRSCPIKNIQSGENVSGSFTSQSCRVLDLVVPSEDETYADPYRITLSRRSVVTFDMKAAGFDTYLVLATPRLQALFENDDAGDNTTDSRLLASLEPGSYLVLAGMFEVSTGAYTASVQVEDVRSCPPKDVGRGDSVSGSLSPTGCRYLDVVVPSDDPTPTDAYRLNVDARGVLSLGLSATDFSPYLVLADAAYDPLYESGDFGQHEAKAELLVMPGTYYALTSSFDGDGIYSLTTRFGAPRDCPAPALALGQTQSGRLEQGGCRFQDLAPLIDSSFLTNQYQLTLAQRGLLTVRVSSTEFAPAVIIADATNTRTPSGGSDFNVGGRPTAQASATLPAGTYNILVLTLGSGRGAYEIGATFEESSAVTQPPTSRLRIQAADLQK